MALRDFARSVWLPVFPRHIYKISERCSTERSWTKPASGVSQLQPHGKRQVAQFKCCNTQVASSSPVSVLHSLQLVSFNTLDSFRLSGITPYNFWMSCFSSPPHRSFCCKDCRLATSAVATIPWCCSRSRLRCRWRPLSPNRRTALSSAHDVGEVRPLCKAHAWHTSQMVTWGTNHHTTHLTIQERIEYHTSKSKCKLHLQQSVPETTWSPKYWNTALQLCTRWATNSIPHFICCLAQLCELTRRQRCPGRTRLAEADRHPVLAKVSWLQHHPWHHIRKIHRSLDRHGKLKDFHHLRQLRRDSMQSPQLNGWKKGPFGSLVDLCFHDQVVHHLAPLPAFRSPSTCKDATRIVGRRVSEHCLPQWLSIEPPSSDLFTTKKPELNVNERSRLSCFHLQSFMLLSTQPSLGSDNDDSLQDMWHALTSIQIGRCCNRRRGPLNDTSWNDLAPTHPNEKLLHNYTYFDMCVYTYTQPILVYSLT